MIRLRTTLVAMLALSALVTTIGIATAPASAAGNCFTGGFGGQAVLSACESPATVLGEGCQDSLPVWYCWSQYDGSQYANATIDAIP